MIFFSRSKFSMLNTFGVRGSEREKNEVMKKNNLGFDRLTGRKYRLRSRALYSAKNSIAINLLVGNELFS